MSTAPSPLITVPALAALLERHGGTSSALLVVDCRFELSDPGAGRRAWAEGHVPGAVYAHLDEDLSGPVTPASGRHPLPDPAAFASTLARWGVTAQTQVVAYDAGPGAMAARLWWLLRATGHEAVQVLDGGLGAWRAAGLPVDTSPARRTPVAAGAARPFRGWLSSAEVAAAMAAGSILLVDARGADRFAGRNETIDPVAGHVPGAVNHPFMGNVGPDGRFLPPEELRRRWQATLGGRSTAQAVMMCGSGVTACHNLLALAQAGFTDARLYAGSWSEWIRDPARAIAT